MEAGFPVWNKRDLCTIWWHEGAVPADTVVLKWLIHFYLVKSREIIILLHQRGGFPSCPHIIRCIFQPRFAFFFISQAAAMPDQHPDTSTRRRNDARRPERQLRRRQRLAPLTSLTVPPLPHTQSHGAHFQMVPGWRRSSHNGTSLAAPSSLSWTILPEGLLKTEPPIDATRRQIILNPVATTTPHNVSGNAVCRRTPF